MSIKDHRTRRLWTVRELADRAGVSPQTIVNIEVHGKRPRLVTARRISDALGVPPMAIKEFAAMLSGDAPPPTV